MEKWHMFHFDVLFSNGSQGYFFDYKLVNIWLDKINPADYHEQMVVQSANDKD